jgi:hypothetical protein
MIATFGILTLLTRVRFPKLAIMATGYYSAIAWWDWPVELVGKHLRTIMGNDLDKLADLATAFLGATGPRIT